MSAPRTVVYEHGEHRVEVVIYDSGNGAVHLYMHNSHAYEWDFHVNYTWWQFWNHSLPVAINKAIKSLHKRTYQQEYNADVLAAIKRTVKAHKNAGTHSDFWDIYNSQEDPDDGRPLDAL